METVHFMQRQQIDLSEDIIDRKKAAGSVQHESALLKVKLHEAAVGPCRSLTEPCDGLRAEEELESRRSISKRDKHRPKRLGWQVEIFHIRNC